MKDTLSNLTRRWPSVALGGAAILAGTALAFTQNSTSTSTTQAKITPVNLTLDENPVSRDAVGRASFAPVIKKVSQGVVKVSVTFKAQKTGFGEGQDPNDLMRRFFGGQEQGQGQGRSPKRNSNMPRHEAVGSGVVVTKDGYILTNNHVVENADEVKVAMQDGREFTAKVIGRDPKSDVAVIKIEAKDLPVVSMADSDKIEVGDVVLAIGNPFGIGQTVTTGIVSAKDRGGNLGLDYEDFIQTDAAINPGNSGGALVDADGRLIGINTAILSRSGGNQGIGFAIPVNLARDVMQGLVKDGHVTRGYLGAGIQDMTPALAKEFGLKDGASGALVSEVVDGSPADKGGVKTGDLVVEFNSHKVADSRHLKLEVARTAPGETVAMKVLRDGATKTLNIKVKELPGTEVASADSKDKDTGTLTGVGVADLDKNARAQFKVPENVKGAIVTEVQPDCAAAEAGLKPGDVILEINRKSVKDAETAVNMTEKATDKTTLLRIWRAGGSHFMVVDETKAG